VRLRSTNRPPTKPPTGKLAGCLEWLERYIRSFRLADKGVCPDRAYGGLAAGHRFGHDRPQDLRDFEPLWQIEPALLQSGDSRTQIETDYLGERHRKMCEAAGVDRDTLELADLALAQSAFDGGTGLAAVQDDRLIIDDAPLVEDMGIGPAA
jgi:hypothetical protein